MNPSGAPPALPALTAAESAHSQAVAALVCRGIRARGGWIDFGSFMELALYAPGLGYYSAGSLKLGAAGDFVTAPEVSPLFARCVARQCADVLAQLGGGDILEFGAGTGALAAEVLLTLDALGALPGRYDILEVSADLAERQRRRLAALPPHLAGRVRWLTALPSTPVTGVVLANEVLDALPCRRFVVRGAGIRELGVALADGAARFPAGAATGFTGVAAGAPAAAESAGAFVLHEADADEGLQSAWRALQPALREPLAEGYTSELCPGVAPWIGSVSGLLARGAVLLFDYGLPRAQYYHPQRATGTLTCHFRHRAHGDALINTGVQDITAWVDFTRVAEAAHDAGLEVLGFATQAAFLLGLGILELLPQADPAPGPAQAAADPGPPTAHQVAADPGPRLAHRAVADPALTASGRARAQAARAQAAGAVRRLLLPGEMGEAFKLMALGRGLEEPLAAFAHQDLRDSL